MRDIDDSSVGSKKDLASLRKSSGVEASAAELKNCFGNVLNMALSSAPIQHKSYPTLATSSKVAPILANAQAPQLDSQSRPKFVISSTFAKKHATSKAPSGSHSVKNGRSGALVQV